MISKQGGVCDPQHIIRLRIYLPIAHYRACPKPPTWTLAKESLMYICCSPTRWFFSPRSSCAMMSKAAPLPLGSHLVHAIDRINKILKLALQILLDFDLGARLWSGV